jgi:iron complex transport system ATP-binding protein
MSSASDFPILEIKNAVFGYAKGKALINSLSFSVGNGEFIGLLGANGSGKSTILKLAAGILSPSGGQILLWNKPLKSYKNRDRAKLICYLPQVLDINVPFRVRDLVSMGLYPYDILPGITVDSAIEMVGLSAKKDSYLTNLSGGERRRAFIAMTLVQDAGLLLLDEPLANLDIKYQAEIIRLLRELKDRKNITMLMALHDINLALRFEKIILIKEGNVLGFGKPEKVLTSELLHEAFGISMDIRKDELRGTTISYGNEF